MGQFVTTKQLAERLSMTRQNVIYHIHQGHIAAERPGGRDFLITVEEADRVAELYEPQKHRPWHGLPPLSAMRHRADDTGQEAAGA